MGYPRKYLRTPIIVSDDATAGHGEKSLGESRFWQPLFGQVTHAVERLPAGMNALWCIVTNECEKWLQEFPFRIREIAESRPPSFPIPDVEQHQRLESTTGSNDRSDRMAASQPSISDPTGSAAPVVHRLEISHLVRVRIQRWMCHREGGQ